MTEIHQETIADGSTDHDVDPDDHLKVKQMKVAQTDQGMRINRMRINRMRINRMRINKTRCMNRKRKENAVPRSEDDIVQDHGIAF